MALAILYIYIAKDSSYSVPLLHVLVIKLAEIIEPRGKIVYQNACHKIMGRVQQELLNKSWDFATNNGSVGDYTITESDRSADS